MQDPLVAPNPTPDSRASHVTPRPEPPTWSLPRRIGFRVLFAFAVLCLPLPLDAIPKVGAVISEAWSKGQMHLTAAVARALLHVNVPLTDSSSGSGDTLASYLSTALFLVVAVIAAVVWSVLDRKRTQYATLDAWLRIVMRYSLASAMFTYGFGKVFKAQFPTPGPTHLLEPIGDESPMGLLWTFMGYSTGYTFFAGAGEVLGAALLLFRRTATLGALVVAGVMSNVVALNFCYDVPVKLYSSMLLGMALFVAAPDASALFDVLVRRRATALSTQGPFFTRPWASWAGVAAKTAFIGSTLWGTVSAGYRGWHEYGDGAPRGALDGAYSVESLVEEGAPPREASKQVLKLGIEGGWLLVVHADGTREWRAFVDDATGMTLTIKDHDLLGAKTLKYALGDAEHLSLEGEAEGHRRALVLKRVHSRLMERGFHWVQEKPFNR